MIIQYRNNFNCTFGMLTTGQAGIDLIKPEQNSDLPIKMGKKRFRNSEF